MSRTVTAVVMLVVIMLAPVLRAQEAARPDEGMHAPFSELLDLYVRDGLVYYRALQIDRAKLDRYIASLDVPPGRYERWSRDEKLAFWINAYNAFVLRTVVQNYPIRGRSADYPTNSIRQIPGAFERAQHRAAGKLVTLDEIEKTILPTFDDPRVFLALGRGSVGSTRLRSEAFVGSRLDAQLSSVVAEFVTRTRHIRIDPGANTVSVTPFLSWHEKEFVEAYGKGSDAVAKRFAARSPLERAILVVIEPHLLPLEREFIQRNEFRLTFQDLDWRLNDLTGGRVD